METLVDATTVFKDGKFTMDTMLREEIYPIYKKHQDTFDEPGIHGILHITRSIIAGHILAKQSKKEHAGLSYAGIAMAIMFHDSGRKGNGFDLWEKESSQLCAKYLDSIGMIDSHSIASMIVKDESKQSIAYACVHDADVLEIMRPCCGHGGLAGFERRYLILWKNFPEFLDRLIMEWWGFIIMTEQVKTYLSDADCMTKLLNIINVNKKTYPQIWRGIQ